MRQAKTKLTSLEMSFEEEYHIKLKSVIKIYIYSLGHVQFNENSHYHYLVFIRLREIMSKIKNDAIYLIIFRVAVFQFKLFYSA